MVWGLGNPEQKFQRTRHNFGSLVVGSMMEKEPSKSSWIWPLWDESIIRLEQGRLGALVNRVHMNDSGRVAKKLKKARIDISKVLVVVDDLDLEFGALRLRGAGSDGGHRGLESIISVWGEGFPRLRLGIAPHGDDKGLKRAPTVPYVLGRFTTSEESVLPQVKQDAASAVIAFFTQGLGPAMSLWNRQNLPQISS